MLSRATNTDISLLGPSLSNEHRAIGRLKEREVKHVRISDVADLHDMYSFGDEIGRGSFGIVMSATEKEKETNWAVKIVCKNTLGNRIRFVQQEIHILKMVDHPHIIHLERVYETSAKMYLIMERCIGELGHRFKKNNSTPFPECDVKKVVGEIVSAVAYLHKYEIVHRDLKLENILLTENPNDPTDTLYIKVSDFGLSAVKSGSGYEDMLHDCCGTLIYMPAPEMITNYTYSHQCDVWSIGIMTYLLLSGNFPFNGKSEKEVATTICKEQPSFVNFPGSIESINLIKRMLEKNPAMRITASEIAEHPWLVGRQISEDASPHNVLDMMHLWKPEMMVETGGEESDWLASPESVINKSIAHKRPEHRVSSVYHDANAAKRQSIPLTVKNIEFNRNRSRTDTETTSRGGKKGFLLGTPSVILGGEAGNKRSSTTARKSEKRM